MTTDVAAQAGSSPLVRGAHPECLRVEADRGIIPARAGSTLKWLQCRFLVGDHPRSCGEHAAPVDAVVLAQGSSPLVRGALISHPDDAPSAGIIPARAGSTWTRTIITYTDKDHPRSCGEHT